MTELGIDILQDDPEVPLGKDLIIGMVSARLIETADDAEADLFMRLAMSEILQAPTEHQIKVLIHATYQADLIIRRLVGFIASGLMHQDDSDPGRYKDAQLAVWRHYVDFERDPPQ